MNRTVATSRRETVQIDARFPNLFLVGAPKCGTTSLAYYLSQHSDIFVPILKEPVFFGSDLTTSGRRLPMNDYLNLYRSWSGEAYALDASTHYFYSHQAPTEISAKAPGSKILMILRNPIEAAYSMYYQLRFNGREECDSFEAALDAEPDRKHDVPSITSGFHETMLYSGVYRYSENIQRYCDVFGKDKILAVIIEDMEQNPTQLIQRICDFLDIDNSIVSKFDFGTRNSAKRARAKWIARLANYPPHWVGYFTKPLFSRATRVRVREKLGRLNTISAHNPPLRPQTRRRLVETFRADVTWLGEFLDRDLSHWLQVDD